MRLVQVPAEGELELAYMWLPHWLAINSKLLEEMGNDLSSKIQGLPMDEAGLDKAHDIVVDYLVSKFPTLTGLRDYLDALKFVQS